jgi:hypothetical protein
VAGAKGCPTPARYSGTHWVGFSDKGRALANYENLTGSLGYLGCIFRSTTCHCQMQVS